MRRSERVPGDSNAGNGRRRLLAVAVALLCVLAVAYGIFEALQTWVFRTEDGGNVEIAANTTRESDRAANSANSTNPAGRTEGSSGNTPGSRPLPSPENSCDDLRVLVGRNHALPPNYTPRGLSSLAAYGVPTYGGDHQVRRGVLEPLGDLISAATIEGHEVIVLSAYRSYADQQENFAHFTGIYGEDAEIVSAPPGQSQHQLGTTVDFTNGEVNYQLLPAFGETEASKWLEKNAWRYGFAITYPDGDEAETGRQWEPWEYRYVGRENARMVHESDLSLRDFLLQEGVRPLC